MSIAIPTSIIEGITEATGATNIAVGDTLEDLWSGFGGIIELDLQGLPEYTPDELASGEHIVGKVDDEEVDHSDEGESDTDVAVAKKLIKKIQKKKSLPVIENSSVILKLISPPDNAQHPRGWNTNKSRERKILSYQVETYWYEECAARCNEQCRVPSVIATGHHESTCWILLENLNEHFPKRAMGLSIDQASVVLRWLAGFHANFLKAKPHGLWPIGTYWHLDTRTDELEAMPEGQLKQMAGKLDSALNECPYQTFVHGDAKVANFCFSDDMSSVAAVDFQYVGGGVGIKDVVYFLGSCIDETELEARESELLAVYFTALTDAISLAHNEKLAASVERAWSDLYAIAWTDFYRFLEGWSPGHNKINRYTRKLAEKAFVQLLTR